VKTICPASWSEGEGGGTDEVDGKVAGGTVGKSKSGMSVNAGGGGEEDKEGVEAWSVANRSGFESEAPGRLHPAKATRKRIQVRLRLTIVHFDGIKVEFLTG
jgi:hypothetical protein